MLFQGREALGCVHRSSLGWLGKASQAGGVGTPEPGLCQGRTICRELCLRACGVPTPPSRCQQKPDEGRAVASPLWQFVHSLLVRAQRKQTPCLLR